MKVVFYSFEGIIFMIVSLIWELPGECSLIWENQGECSLIWELPGECSLECATYFNVRRVPHVEQDLLTLPEHLRSPLVFWWGSCCLFLSFLCCVMCAVVCLSFSFLDMALSVCFRFLSLTVPLASFVPLLFLMESCLFFGNNDT